MWLHTLKSQFSSFHGCFSNRNQCLRPGNTPLVSGSTSVALNRWLKDRAWRQLCMASIYFTQCGWGHKRWTAPEFTLKKYIICLEQQKSSYFTYRDFYHLWVITWELIRNVEPSPLLLNQILHIKKSFRKFICILKNICLLIVYFHGQRTSLVT